MYKKLFAAPLALALSISAVAPTLAHAEEAAPTTQAISVKPVISFNGSATSSYDAMFKNATYTKTDNGYDVTMDVSYMFTLFQVNGEDVALQKVEGADEKADQKVTVTLPSLDANPTIKIAYTAGPVGTMSHAFTFDFTPSKEEVVANFEKAAATLSYTKAGSMQDETALKAAEKELKYLTGAIAVAQSLGADTTALTANESYVKQQEVVKAGIATPSVTTPPMTSDPTEDTIKEQVATSVVPVILFKDVPTASYNTSFTNVKYVKDGDNYKVTMNVDPLFNTFKLNGEAVALTADGDKQQVEFILADLNANPTITIGYNANGYNASHDFTFDFTPSVAEVKPAFEATLKALSYTADDAIKTKEDVTAAAKQISAVDGVIASAKASAVDTADLKTNADYDKQVANVKAYKTPFIDAVTSAIAALSYTQAGSITTDEQLAQAQAQLKTATDAEAAATAAGLTARTEIATLENYANIAAQKVVVEAGVTKQQVVQTERALTVKVSNAKGASDIVKVYGVQKGDTVRVYNTKGKVVATKTATSEYVRFAGLNLGKAKGEVSATAQTADQQESAKATVAFKAEPVSKAIAKASVTVKNNKGKNDVVTIKGTVKGEKVRVYDANGKTLKTVTATGKTTKVTIKQLGKKASKIQVARMQAGKHMSAKTTVKFSKEK